MESFVTKDKALQIQMSNVKSSNTLSYSECQNQ